MAVRCRYCGRDYDVTLFEFGRSIICRCGRTVSFSHVRISGGEEDTAVLEEERKVREITAMADRIASLIAASDYPRIDIEIEKRKLREKIEDLFPEKAGLYDLIYEPRFKRLTEQFRGEGG
jgi:hypothetical protein